MIVLIPATTSRGYRYAVMDNAAIHRKNVLRELFWIYDLEVVFLPPYSPWFRPIEKGLLAMNSRCNIDVD
eukprot:gene22107-26639_t